MARKPKRIRLDILEGWGEKQQLDDDALVEHSLAEGWQQGEDQTVITEDTMPEGWQQTQENKHQKFHDQLTSKSFKFKKKGKLKNSEVKELKRTCKSLDGWIKI